MKNFNLSKLFLFIFLGILSSALFGQTTTFNYTGSVQTYTAPHAGKYQLEVWGAQGGAASPYVGGLGGYSKGEVTLVAGQTISIYVGQQGRNPSGGTAWNGGGAGTCCGAGGGGATDIRIGGTSLSNRVIVGGAGGGGSNDIPRGNGGAGGGESGIEGSFDASYTASYAGTQTTGYALGVGESNYSDSGGGGGGCWGGGAGTGSSGGSGGGGSAYIGDVTNGVMIAGNATMPNPAGGTMTGRSGDGIAMVTVLCDPLNISATPETDVCPGTLVTLTATSENGGTVSWNNGVTNGEAFVVNTTTTYTVSSSSIDDCETSVTISIENTPPTVITKDIAIELDESGVATLTPSDVDNNSSDACGIADMSVSPNTFDCSDIIGYPGTPNNIIEQTLSGYGGGGKSHWQSWTAITDGLLNYIEVYHGRPNSSSNTTVYLDLYEGEGIDGELVASAVNNQVVSNITGNKFYPYNFEDVIIHENQKYTWHIYFTTAQTSGWISFSDSNPYPGGKGYYGGSFFENTDFLFKVNVSPLIPHPVTLTVTDYSGNVGTAVANVTVEDNVKPTVLTKNIIVQLDSEGNAGIVAADVDEGSSDACGIQSMTVLPNSFTCTEEGENTVTLTVTDNNGNVQTADATVTVEDNVKPTVMTKDITVQLDSEGNAGIVAADVDDGSNDACGIQSMTVLPNSFTCTEEGENTVTLTVTDNNGNVQTADATVTVEDNVKPTVITKDITVQLDSEGNAGIVAADVDDGSNDACGIQSMTVLPNSFTCTEEGENTVTLTVTDNNGNVQTADATVTVEDNVKPTVMTKDITVQLDSEGNAGIVAADVDDGSSDACGIQSMTVLPNSFTCTEERENTVTLAVTDNNGNVQTADATVTVEDNVKPTVMTKDITVQLDSEGNAGIVAADVDDGSNDACGIQSMTVLPNSFTCTEEGENTVTLTVTDNNGNVQTADATVTVEDNVKPTVITKDITVQLDSEGNAGIVAADVDDGSSDACGIQSMTVLPNSFTCTEEGENTVTLTVTDNNGNVQTADATVTVEDNVKPTVMTKDITVQLDSEGNAGIVAADVDDGSSDACGIQSMTVLPNSFTCTEEGENTVTLTVTDNNGNVQTADATVTVEDNVKPTVMTKDITVQLDSEGNAGIVAADVDDGSNDACGIQSMTVLPNSFTCTEEGENTVTLTVTDNNGNVSTYSSVVTVLDTVSPVAVCQNTAISLDGTGNVSINATQVDGGSTDNCNIDTMYLDRYDFSVADFGMTFPVKLTVSDVSGNTSTCTSQVTIVDNSGPRLVTHKIKVYLGANGQHMLTDAEKQALTSGTTDNITAPEDIQFSFNPSGFRCYNIGDNQKIQVIATDESGNETRSWALANVMDTFGLHLATSVEDMEVTVGAGECGTTITYPDMTPSNKCTEVKQLEGLGPDGMFPIGTTTEKWLLTNPYTGDSLVVSFNVTVTSDNLPPTIDMVSDVNLFSHASGIEIPLTGISDGGDCQPQDLMVTATHTNPYLVDSIGVDYTSADSSGMVSLYFVPNMSGTDTVTVKVTDSEGGETMQTFTVGVDMENDPPTLNPVEDVMTYEDTTAIEVPLTGITDGDVLRNQDLTVMTDHTNAELITGIMVDYTSPNETGMLTLMIAPDMNGTDTITVTIEDSEGATTKDTFVVTVIPVNDPPYLVNPIPDQKVNASYPWDITLSSVLGEIFNDIDDTMLNLDILLEDGSDLPGWIKTEVTGTEYKLTGIPTLADTGCVNILVQAFDKDGAMATDTFTLCVEGYPVSVQDIGAGEFEVTMYPNPTRGAVNIDMNSNNIGEVQLSVMDIAGRVVLQKHYSAADKMKFNMSEKVSGMYFVNIDFNGNHIIKKLLVDRK